MLDVGCLMRLDAKSFARFRARNTRIVKIKDNKTGRCVMKTSLRFLALGILIGVFTIGLGGCGSGVIKSHQSYDKLQPIGKVPQTSSTPNLVIQINNVADEGKSRKNTVELFINDKPVAPSNKGDGPRRDYVYELLLASGVYKIKAIYRAKSFWEDKEYTITTKDGKVRVYPGRNTFLSIALDKKPNGKLKQRKSFFIENDQVGVAKETQAAPAPVVTQPEQRALPRANNIGEIQTFAIAFVNQEHPNRSLMPQRRIEFPDPRNAITSPRPERVLPGQAPKREVVEEKPEMKIPAAPAESTPVITNAVPAQPAPEERIERLPPSPEPVVERSEPRGDQIALQINTVPLHAEVIVDDKYLGLSPLITYIDRHTDHVIQISKPGYEEKMKLINRHEFGEQKIYFLIEKLEAKK
jgi:hypothetical protein